MSTPLSTNSYSLTVVAAVNVALLLLFLTVSTSKGSHIMEIILEEEPPMVQAAIPPGSPSSTSSSSPPSRTAGILEFEENMAGGNVANTNPALSNGQCNIEFQVLKVYPGHCMRLGRNGGGRGCVSGNHIVPFHPDCM